MKAFNPKYNRQYSVEESLYFVRGREGGGRPSLSPFLVVSFLMGEKVPRSPTLRPGCGRPGAHSLSLGDVALRRATPPKRVENAPYLRFPLLISPPPPRFFPACNNADRMSPSPPPLLLAVSAKAVQQRAVSEGVRQLPVPLGHRLQRRGARMWALYRVALLTRGLGKGQTRQDSPEGRH